MSSSQKEKFLLGIDVGSTGVKAVLYDTNGGTLAKAEREHPTMHPRPGWAEQSPSLWWKSTKEAVQEILSRVGSSTKYNIAGIGVSGQGPTVLPVDEKGEPLRPAIIWMDTRGGKQHDPVPKFLWIKQNEPEILQRTHRFLSSSGFITLKLTGEFTLNITQAPGASFQMPDFLDNSFFPEVRLFSEVIGEVTKEAAQETGLAEGTPVVAGADDGFATIIGAGATKTGRAVEYTGLSCVLCIRTDKPYPEVQDRGLFLGGMGDFYIISGQMSTGGGLLRWFRDTLGYLEMETAKSLNLNAYQIMDLEASSVPPGSDGLVILPYFSGERAPIWNANARGVIFGLYLTHSRAHLIRAALEAVAYGLRHIIEIAEGAGVRIDELRATGGGSNSDLWLQIKADVLNRPIYRISDGAGTLGNAIMAGAGVGVFDDLFSKGEELARVKKVIHPDPERHKLYTSLYQIYRELYESLKASFDKLAETQIHE